MSVILKKWITERVLEEWKKEDATILQKKGRQQNLEASFGKFDFYPRLITKILASPLE